MKRKKGFTLVELLAVIVILAVVILIAVTAVIPRMNNAKKNSLLDEALIYLKAAREDFVISSHESEEPITSKCMTISELNEKYVKKNDTNYSGTVISEYNNGEFTQTISLTNGKYYVYGSGNIDKNNIYDSEQNGYVESCSTGIGYEDLDKSTDLTLGDRISIGNDRFYYITTDSNGDLVFLSEYNLDSASRQSSTSDTIKYSGNTYWSGSSDFTPFRDSTYKYIYRTTTNRTTTSGDTNNDLKDRINSYKDYLNELGTLSIIDARLMSYEEALDTGCKNGKTNSCPEWSSNQSYWLGSCIQSESSGNIHIINSDNKYIGNSFRNYAHVVGVRPVIIISPSSI